MSISYTGIRTGTGILMISSENDQPCAYDLN